MNATATYFLGQIELFLALACLASVIALGQVGRGLFILCSVIAVKNLVDTLALIKISSVSGASTEITATGHGTFICSYAVAIFSIYILHRQTNTPFTLYVRFYLIAMCTSMGLHLATAIERIYFQRGIITSVYIYSIPVINYICLFSIMFGLYKVYRRRQEFGERINWTS